MTTAALEVIGGFRRIKPTHTEIHDTLIQIVRLQPGHIRIGYAGVLDLKRTDASRAEILLKPLRLTCSARASCGGRIHEPCQDKVEIELLLHSRICWRKLS